jgi:hypothetical protein
VFSQPGCGDERTLARVDLVEQSSQLLALRLREARAVNAKPAECELRELLPLDTRERRTRRDDDFDLGVEREHPDETGERVG